MKYRTNLANFAGRPSGEFRDEIEHRHIDDLTTHLLLRTLKSLSGVRRAYMMGALAWCTWWGRRIRRCLCVPVQVHVHCRVSIGRSR